MADGVVIFDVELDSSGLSGQLSGLGNKLAKGAAIAAAGAAVGKAFGAAVGAGMDFESIMSKVEALSGATDAQMVELTEAAKVWGAETSFSASEVGSAFTYMAQAGWQTEAMLAGIGPILNLAAADGLDLATTSDIVTDSLTAFGLTAADTSMYADVLATAAAASNTNVHMLGETFKYAAPVAGALGYNVKDVALAVGLMANAGIKGSQAGTALRGVLSRMAKPTKQSQQAMDALGVSLSNADGTMKPLSEVMGDLRKGFAGLTEEQQASYAAMLAGQEGMSGLLAIVNASEEDYNNLADAIENSKGSAERMAKIMMDNLAGDVEEFKGAAETLALEFYETFSDSLRTAVQTGTSIVNKLTEGVKAGDLSSALSSIFSEDVPQISAMIGEKLGEAIGKLPELFEDTGDVASSLLSGLAKGTKALAEGIVKGIGDNMPTLLPDIASALIGGLASSFETLPDFVDAATSIVDGLKKALIGSDVEGAESSISEQMTSLGKSLVESLTKAVSKLPDLAVSVGEIIGALAKSLGEGLAGLAEGVTDEGLAKSFGDFAKAIVEGIAAAIPGIADGISALGSALVGGLKNWLAAGDAGEDTESGVATFAKELLGSIATEIENNTDGAQKISDALNNVIGNITLAEENAKSFVSDSLVALNSALTALSTWCTENKALVVAALGALGTAFLLINAPLVLTGAAIAIVVANWNSLKEAATKLAESLTESLSKAGQAIEDFMKKLSPFITGDFSGGNPFPEGSFMAGFFENTALINENQEIFTWEDVGEWFASLFPSAGAEELEIPESVNAAAEQAAGQMEENFHLALAEAFQNGEISYAELVAAAFGGGEGETIVPEDQMAEIYAQMQMIGAQMKASLIAGMTGAGEGAEGAMAGVAGDAAGEGAESENEGLIALGLALAQAVATGVSKGAPNIKSELSDAVDKARSDVEKTELPKFKTLGEQICQGIADGIESNSGVIATALVNAVMAALDAAKSALGIASPSKVFRDEVGRWIPVGAADGVKLEAWQLRSAARSMVLDSVAGLGEIGRKAASNVHFGWADARLAKQAAFAAYGQPIQEVNFNVPVQTPDEFAETVELFMTYGLEADY